MNLLPWMTRRFMVALVAMAVLFVLLVAASVRLLSIENQLTDYISEDMVWLSSQGQYEAMRFADALGSYEDGDMALADVQLRLDLLSSRIAILEQGEPYRQLQGFNLADRLVGYRATVDMANERLKQLQADDSASINGLHAEAIELAASLRDVANSALFGKREKEAATSARRRGTLFEVLATLVATMAAFLLMAGVLIRDHRNMVSAESALERERQVSRLHRAFISVVSHQFRTPLAIIDASAQRMIRRGSQMDTEEIHSRAEKIRHACLRLTRLMESTLNAARLEEGEIALNIRACDIKGLLQNVVENQPEQDQRRIEVKTDNLPTWVEADATLLEQAVQNLVSNAIKYSPNGDPVLINARRSGNEVSISVTDYGVGVPADEMDSLFRRFFRARTAEGIPGTGIGLSFVAQIMELHDGKIDVTSVEGRGSTFTLRLPVSRPDTEKETMPNQTSEARAG
jgi:two-component system sensor histidine kinase SenX3